MAYLINLRLEDTRLEFDTSQKRDATYIKILQVVSALGIPDTNITMDKVDTQISSFTRRTEYKRVGGNRDG